MRGGIHLTKNPFGEPPATWAVARCQRHSRVLTLRNNTNPRPSACKGQGAELTCRGWIAWLERAERECEWTAPWWVLSKYAPGEAGGAGSGPCWGMCERAVLSPQCMPCQSRASHPFGAWTEDTHPKLSGGEECSGGDAGWNSSAGWSCSCGRWNADCEVRRCEAGCEYAELNAGPGDDG
eukprot:1239161-Rhodomonas_salina.3